MASELMKRLGNLVMMYGDVPVFMHEWFPDRDYGGEFERNEVTRVRIEAECILLEEGK